MTMVGKSEEMPLVMVTGVSSVSAAAAVQSTVKDGGDARP